MAVGACLVVHAQWCVPSGVPGGAWLVVCAWWCMAGFLATWEAEAGGVK